MIIDATVETKIKAWNSKKNSSGLVPIYVVTTFENQRKFKSTGLWIKPDKFAEVLPLLEKLVSPQPMTLTLGNILDKYDASASNKMILNESIVRFKELFNHNLTTDDITLNNLLKFKKSMEIKGNSDSTISIRLRCLRTLFNYSKRMGLHHNPNPFVRGLIPTPKPKKKVVKWIVPDNDIYKLQLALGGIDYADAIQVLKLKPCKGYHQFTRYKNRRRGTIQTLYVSNYAYKLIQKINSCIKFESLEKMRFKQIKLLTKYGVSSKCPRYQVAQWLQKNGCPREIIAEILGHVRKDVTDRYLKPEKIKKWIEKLSRKITSRKVLTS